MDSWKVTIIDSVAIKWDYMEGDFEELPDSQYQHIKECLQHNISDGPLAYCSSDTGYEYAGYWRIKGCQ